MFSDVGLVALVPFLILLFQRRSQVWVDFQLSSDGASRLRVAFTWVKCAWYVPIPTGPRPAKPNARKVHYRPSTQVVHSFTVRIHRSLVVNLGRYDCHHYGWGELRAVLRSGTVPSALFPIGYVLKSPSSSFCPYSLYSPLLYRRSNSSAPCA